MTKENILKDYKHFCFLAAGKFEASDFDKHYGNGGRMTMGDLPKARRDLMISNAVRAKEDMEKKYPELLDIKDNSKEKVEEEKPKAKSKEKK